MKKICQTIIASILTLSLSGCANMGANYRPIIDNKVVNTEKYEQDLKECQEFAKQAPSATDGVIAGAVVGTLIGAALGASTGNSYVRNSTMNFGGTYGAMSGGASAEGTQRSIIKKCLDGRGYRVLN
jgi:outer membrane lipoprotein SlyB